MAKSKPRIAIIGAGIAGLTLARALQTRAVVTVFDKARGVGGRMATRRAEPFAFDHGTQFFTARSRAFRDFLELWKKAGIVSEWAGDVATLTRGAAPKERFWFEPHYVAQPGMTGLAKAMAKGIDVQTGVEIAPLAPYHGSWTLTDVSGRALGEFDWLISTAPPAQTVRLLGDVLSADNPIAPMMLQGCYALMVGFDHPKEIPWIGAKVEESPLAWISVDSSKPGRDASVTSLVAHSRNDWADEHIEMDALTVQQLLLDELQYVTGLDCIDAAHVGLHRWRYALVGEPQKAGPYLDVTQKLAAVGDWSVTSRIEEAWYASTDLAERVLELL